VTAVATTPASDPVWGRAAGAARAALIGGGATAAALPAAGVAFGPGWLGPLVVAVGGAAFVSLVVRIAVDRGAAVVLVVAHLLAAPLVAAIVVSPAADGATALGGLGDATARLLSSLPPVDPRGPEMALAVMATWWATALATGVAARPEAGAAVVAPGAALFAAGLAVGDPRRTLPTESPAAVAAAAGLVLVAAVLRRSAAVAAAGPAGGAGAVPSRPLRAAARLVTGAVVVAIAVGVAVVVTPRVPGLVGRERVDVRAGRDVPVDVRLGESPLDAVPTARRADEPTTRFTARVDLPAGHDARLAWRLAVLDRLGPDGWSASPTTYVRAGSVLGAPPADEAARRGAAHVELDLGPAPAATPALPTLDRPTGVTPSGLAVDRRSGLLAVPAGSDRPLRLSLDVALPTLRPADLVTATAPRRDPGPEVPDPVRLRVQQITGGVRQPLQVLQLISRALSADPSLTLDPTRTGLTRTAVVLEALQAGASGGAATVNDAQLAAAFALLARADGLQVRLVVGHLTPVAGREAEIEVTDASLTVWPEVLLDDLGWVPFPVRAPAGGSTVAPDPLTTGSGGVVDGAFDQQAAADRAEQSRAGQEARAPVPPPAPTSAAGGSRWWVPVVVLAGVVVLALAGLGPGRRLVRRRRRRSGSPAARVVGAWDDVVESLARARLGVSADRTRPEVRDVAAELVDEDADAQVGVEVRWLTGQADGVAFGAAEPSAADAARAWAAAARVRTAARRSLPPARRVLTTVQPARRPRPSG